MWRQLFAANWDNDDDVSSHHHKGADDHRPGIHDNNDDLNRPARSMAVTQVHLRESCLSDQGHYEALPTLRVGREGLALSDGNVGRLMEGGWRRFGGFRRFLLMPVIQARGCNGRTTGSVPTSPRNWLVASGSSDPMWRATATWHVLLEPCLINAR